MKKLAFEHFFFRRQEICWVGSLEKLKIYYVWPYLYRGYWHTKQLLAFNPLISKPYLHPFGTEEANCRYS